jgi:hypothetical protein
MCPFSGIGKKRPDILLCPSFVFLRLFGIRHDLDPREPPQLGLFPFQTGKEPSTELHPGLDRLENNNHVICTVVEKARALICLMSSSELFTLE